MNETKTAYLLSRILSTPFWAVYNMLPFILYKDLEASLFQLTLVVATKPLVSLLSMYWSDGIHMRRDLLRKNIMLGTLLGHLPFMLFPWVQNGWFLIFCSAFYMTMARGIVPAWMEILKLNLPPGKRERIFSLASAFGYIGGGLLPFPIGWVLDHYAFAWQWIFPVTACISLLALLAQLKIPVKQRQKASAPSPKLLARVKRPFSNVFALLAGRPDFARYQMGFMLGGAGLIVMQPALPIFFVDNLQLSYTELAVAITLCKGIGFGATFPLWSRWFAAVDIYRFNSLVTFTAFLFPIALLFAEVQIFWLYFAYICYGMMQAGSELSWNMSGPIFAKDEDSSLFTNVNLVTVGLRGAVMPLIGTILCRASGPLLAMMTGGVFCLLATFWMYRAGFREYAIKKQAD